MSTNIQMTKKDEDKSVKQYTLGEEIFNSVTHGVGALLAIAGGVVLIVMSAKYTDAQGVVSSVIYFISMFLLYLSSTLYHAITNTTAKKVFRVFDHCTIFLLIAGTYTPFALITLRDTIGWWLFGIIWAVAILGIVLNAINIKKFEKISLILYLIMGWAAVFTIKPLLASISLGGVILLGLGGLMYTGGVAFYKMKKYKYMHSIWHLFVLAGTVLHFFAILFYVVLGW